MTNDSNDADRGRGGLRDHIPQIAPPPDLERRVRATLESRGLVRQTAPVSAAAPRRAAWVSRIGLIAAGILIGFFARGSLGSTGGRPNGTAVAGQYVLLLYGHPVDDTGAVHLARAKEYGRWASALSDGAKWVGGHELADVVEQLEPGSVASGPGADRLAGYFVIEAPSRERAAEVARTCPHLKYGGRIVVMTIAS